MTAEAVPETGLIHHPNPPPLPLSNYVFSNNANMIILFFCHQHKSFMILKNAILCLLACQLFGISIKFNFLFSLQPMSICHTILESVGKYWLNWYGDVETLSLEKHNILYKIVIKQVFFFFGIWFTILRANNTTCTILLRFNILTEGLLTELISIKIMK